MRRQRQKNGGKSKTLKTRGFGSKIYEIERKKQILRLVYEMRMEGLSRAHNTYLLLLSC